VVGVVKRGGDEEPAGVLDAVGGDPPQDPVLADALLGGARILDRVAATGMQQAVEASAGALGQIRAIDQDDSRPRRAASQATPAPVPPPPITRTSVLRVTI
jgi:hypothetical protein